jgi:TonB family protein
MKIFAIAITLICNLFATPAYSKFEHEINAIHGFNCIYDDSTEQVFTIVEQMPSFVGGNDSLKAYLVRNIKYPEQAIKDSIQGRVFVTFVVNSNGEVKQTKVLRGVNEELNQEAIRVVSSMPNWEPGKQNGKKVSVQYNLPINFILK